MNTLPNLTLKGLALTETGSGSPMSLVIAKTFSVQLLQAAVACLPLVPMGSGVFGICHRVCKNQQGLQGPNSLPLSRCIRADRGNVRVGCECHLD